MMEKNACLHTGVFVCKENHWIVDGDSHHGTNPWALLDTLQRIVGGMCLGLLSHFVEKHDLAIDTEAYSA